jgi:hypothetical protein
VATGIFISYRHADGGGFAGRLYDSLHAVLRRRADIFMDVEKLDPGTDFVDALEAAIAKCGVVLVVIDPTWISVTDDPVERRDAIARPSLITAAAASTMSKSSSDERSRTR